MEFEEKVKTMYNKLPEILSKNLLWLMCALEVCTNMYNEEKEKNKLLQLENRKLREKIDYLEEQNETKM